MKQNNSTELLGPLDPNIALANKAINWPIKAINNMSNNLEIMENQDLDI